MKKGLALAPLLFLALSSCQKEPQSSELGPSTSPEAISLAQRKSLAKLNPYSVEKGQTVHFIETQEVITSQSPVKQISKEWLVEVTDVEFQPGIRLITTLKSVSDKLWDEDFIYQFKDVLALEDVDTAQALDQLNENRYSLKQQVATAVKAADVDPIEVEGVAYHNLRVQSVTMVPPQLVKDAKNCKGLQNCQLQADQITYDIVFLMSDGSTQKHGIETFISPDAPYFAGILKQCATTFLPVDKLTVFVKQCVEVVDFTQN